jgi:pimeloyl-ACP methyl ester carboxylesterase
MTESLNTLGPPTLLQGILARPWWREYRKPHQRFSVTTRDGVGLQGVHIDNGHETLVVYCHGFLSSKNFLAVPRFMEMLSEDVDVIAFDFRGHGESGGASTLGERECSDVDAVVDYARAEGYRRIFLAGSSMGGAVAIRYAADSQEIAGVVTVGAFARGEFSYAARKALEFFDWPVTHTLVQAARRTRVESTALGSAPADVVHKLSPRPLLLIHGEYDLLVPVHHAFELYERAGDPKELVVIPRASHDIANLNRKTKERIIDWIRSSESKDLGPGAQDLVRFGHGESSERGSGAAPLAGNRNRSEGPCSIDKS